MIANESSCTRLGALDMAILAFTARASASVTTFQCVCARSIALDGVRIVFQVALDKLQMVAGQSHIDLGATLSRARSAAN